MGLFSSLRDGDDAPDDETPDAYRVMKTTPKGGWKPVEGFDDMNEPIAKDTFEYNASPLDPGNYRLFAVQDNLNQQPPDGVGWTLEVEGTNRDDQDGEIAEIKREIRAMREEGSQQEPDDPQELVERQKASLQLAALQSEDFLKQYGDEIVLGMFDADGRGGSDGTAIGFEDWQENPVGSTLYETLNMVREDPQQVERLGEAIGRGVGTFVGGAADGMSDSGGSLADVKEAAEQDGKREADPDPDPDPTGGRDLDAGPSDPSDLGAGDPTGTDDLAESLADTRTQLREAGPGTQDRPTDAPDAAEPPTPSDPPDDTSDETDENAATIDDSDPMTATPTDTTTTDTTDSSDDNTADEIAGAL